MSLSKNEINKIKKQSLINLRVGQYEKIANNEALISALQRQSLLDAGQDIQVTISKLKDENEKSEKFINVINDEIKKYGDENTG